MTDRFETPSPLIFYECQNSMSTIYLSDEVNDVREFELPIINTCELFRKIQPAAFCNNVYILLKYNSNTWSGTYSISNIPHSTLFVQSENQCLEINLKDVEEFLDDYEGEGVCLEAIIGYSCGKMEVIPLSLNDKEIESTTPNFLRVGDTIKRYARWSIPFFVVQTAVALISYLMKGDPKYYLFSLGTLILNNIGMMFDEYT